MKDILLFLHVIWRCVFNTCTCSIKNQKPVLNNPVEVRQSVIPWRFTTVVLLLGVGTLIAGEVIDKASLTEVGKAMIYLPLGSIFGMGSQVFSTARQQMKEHEQEEG